MTAWKSWFEIQIEKESIDCINATEGGAAINGAKRLCLQEAVMVHGGRHNGIKKKIQGAPPVHLPVDMKTVKNGLKNLAERAREIKLICSLGIREAEKIQHAARSAGEGGASENGAAVCIGFVKKIMKEEDFLSINQWRLESVLNKIQRLQSGIKTSTPEKKSYVSAELYKLFFKEVYLVTKEFEKNVRPLIGVNAGSDARMHADVH
ncbi:MAG: hypothetical protein IEMM0002_0409 [bacterium]|nr:MAG: hypothetical protein IEMM0002_0409 [bacterium]